MDSQDGILDVHNEGSHPSKLIPIRTITVGVKVNGYLLSNVSEVGKCSCLKVQLIMFFMPKAGCQVGATLLLPP